MKNGIKYFYLCSFVLGSMLFTGCFYSPSAKRTEDVLNKKLPVEKILDATFKKNIKFKNTDFVGLKKIPIEEYNRQHDGLWLNKKVSVKIKSSVSAIQLLMMLRAEGINISSAIPLGSYIYTGYGVENVSTETALKNFLGSMHLDYKVHYKEKLVIVVPMPWKTWYVNIGDRTTQYQSGSSGSGGGDDDDDAVESTSSSSISIKDNFWESLRKEIEEKMIVLMPSKSESGSMLVMPPTAGSLGGNTPKVPDKLYETQSVGRFSINPETGAVSIQAPHWIIDDLENYFKRIELQYNTILTFQGRIYMVKTDNKNSKGFDIAAFTEFIQGYNMFFRNNALGGITLTTGDAIKIQSGTSSIASSVIGFGREDKGFYAFNAFLEQNGDVSVIQKPIITTTSGVPGFFSKFEKQYYNSISQETSGGSDGGATVGTSNEMVPVELGTSLRLNPRYDVENGLVRVQVTLNQKLLSGMQSTIQYVSSADGSIDEVPTAIPITTESTFEGEAIMTDGDIIIIGGQVERSVQKNDQGIPYLKDTPGLGHFFGVESDSGYVLTYYFALTVNIEKK